MISLLLKTEKINRQNPSEICLAPSLKNEKRQKTFRMKSFLRRTFPVAMNITGFIAALKAF